MAQLADQSIEVSMPVFTVRVVVPAMYRIRLFAVMALLRLAGIVAAGILVVDVLDADTPASE